MNEFRESNKKHLKEMSPAGKLQYFKDYYLLPTVLISAGALFVIYFLYTYFRPQPVHVLQVAVFDSAAEEEGIRALTEELGEALDADDPTDQILFQTNYVSSDSGDLARLGVMTAAHEIDCIIAPADVFTRFAAGGYFVPLTDVMDESEIAGYGDAVMRTAGWADVEGEAGTDDPGAGAGDVLPYGISLSGSGKWAACAACADPVAAFVKGGTAYENAAAMIRLLLPRE
ncbi:MAG: hypothetical protein IJJ38_01385 [Lachnospiraceae bacterium]|nr:hypothetical protein [Lachnospiraceae bacterium]